MPNTYPDKFIYVCYCSTRKCLILTGASLENKTLFLINYLATPRPRLTLHAMLNKKVYMLKMMLLHSNLATYGKVFSNFVHCELPHQLIMHGKFDTYRVYLTMYLTHTMFKWKAEYITCLYLINNIWRFSCFK